MDNNPSPGNKAGGLTTILEKSLGAVAKGGTANLVDVFGYGEPITAKASCSWTRRATIRCRSPDRSPAAAMSSASRRAVDRVRLRSGTEYQAGHELGALSSRMPDDIDVNCGGIADGTNTVAQSGQEISRIVRVASGEPTLSEAQGFGESEFAPWQIGAVM